MFDWDEENRAHVKDHGFSTDDVEAAVTDLRRVSAPAYNTDTETRKAVIGKTDDDGAIIFVVTTRRGNKTRVVTARDAERHEQRRYRRRGK